MTLRERWEGIERQILAPWAARSAESRGRDRGEEPCALRTAFQRDRDRIVHSKAFRRLKHKTQVFLSPAGDHYRTRLTHTLEVSQIARTIARALALNEDLAEAIALGHDLGHTPFGHMGERILDALAREHGMEDGFHHARQSLRIVTMLERDGKGLNLTWEVRDGILHHSKGQVDVRMGFIGDMPGTHEGAVVRIADSIAYLNHDLDDALRGGIVSFEDLPDAIPDRLGRTHGRRIGALVADVVASSGEHGVCMSAEMLDVVECARNFLYSHVYAEKRAQTEEPKVDHVLRSLSEILWERHKKEMTSYEEVIDYMAGMTDRYALQLFERFCVPFPWPLEGMVSWRAHTV